MEDHYFHTEPVNRLTLLFIGNLLTTCYPLMDRLTPHLKLLQRFVSFFTIARGGNDETFLLKNSSDQTQNSGIIVSYQNASF